MGRKKQGKCVRLDNKGKEKRHRMKGKSLDTFTEEMHTAFEGKDNLSTIQEYLLYLSLYIFLFIFKSEIALLRLNFECLHSLILSWFFFYFFSPFYRYSTLRHV